MISQFYPIMGTRREMLDTVNAAYDAFDARRKQEEARQADEDDLKELEAEIPAIKSRTPSKRN